MEYSIQEMSKLAGVTTRALRWYDKIGLLKPSRTSESGYRYYGPAEVDRLQDILYYRALGVELARIRESLDDPSFDRLSALRSHLSTLLSLIHICYPRCAHFYEKNGGPGWTEPSR